MSANQYDTFPRVRIRAPSLVSTVAKHSERISALETPIGRWIYIVAAGYPTSPTTPCYPAATPADYPIGDDPLSPVFLNSWENVSGMQPVAFRQYPSGTLQLEGALSGGTVGTVAFRLPTSTFPDPTYWPFSANYGTVPATDFAPATIVNQFALTDASGNPYACEVDTSGNVTITGYGGGGGGGGLNWGTNIDSDSLGLYLQGTGTSETGAGIAIASAGTGGITIDDQGGGGIFLTEGESGGISLIDDSSSGGKIVLQENDGTDGYIQIVCNGGGTVESGGETASLLIENTGTDATNGNIVILDTGSGTSGFRIQNNSDGPLLIGDNGSGATKGAVLYSSHEVDIITGGTKAVIGGGGINLMDNAGDGINIQSYDFVLLAALGGGTSSISVGDSSDYNLTLTVDSTSPTYLIINGLPTTAVGVPSGGIWLNGVVLTRVP